MTTYMYSLDYLTIYNVYAAVGVNIFACTMLYLMNGFTRRVVGIIELSPDKQTVCISHLNFWGKRVKYYIPIEQIVPLSDLPERTSDIYFKLPLFHSDEYFYMSLKYGGIVNKELFEETLG